MKIIEFAGYNWEIKDSSKKPVGPGPNIFSSAKKNVFIDRRGLHLRTSLLKNNATCAEVVLEKPLGFGTYEFELIADLNKLEKNTVIGAFLYEDDQHEIDIEFSPKMVGENLGQYVVQPGKKEGNVFLFKIPFVLKTKHKIFWSKSEINFQSFKLPENDLIYEAKYSGPDIPQEENAKMIFNLWLYEGKRPEKEEEIVISRFNFTP